MTKNHQIREFYAFFSFLRRKLAFSPFLNVETLGTICIYKKIPNTFTFLQEALLTEVDISPGCGYNSTKTKAKRERSGFGDVENRIGSRGRKQELR